MPNDDKSTQWQLLPQFLLVLLLSVGIYWAPWPLEGERPPQTLGPLSVEGVETVDARLWQDPFAAVQRYREREQESGRGRPGEGSLCLAQLGRLAGDKCAEEKRCEVLGVMVFGGPYMGMEEHRRRTRYAVLAGLNAHGYSPDDAEHIGYVKARDTGVPSLPDMVVPFEWLTKDGSGEPLLLLWLDEDALVREVWRDAAGGDKGFIEVSVLGRLRKVVSPIMDGCGECGLSLIGPASSGTLLRMAKEGNTWMSLADVLGGEKARGWYAYSPTSDTAWSSASGSALPCPPGFSSLPNVSNLPNLADDVPGLSSPLNLPDLTDLSDVANPPTFPDLPDARKPLNLPDLADLLGCRGLPIVRVTSTDAQLVGRFPKKGGAESGSGLLRELRLRGLDEERDLVVLVAQWDTAYSRRLVELLREGLPRRLTEERLITSYYLRGLDGEIPGKKGNGKEGKDKGNGEKSAKDRTRQVERPEGDAQRDYLRRLIGALRQREQAASRQGWASVRAVGVLGDDYHDKLLVLEALQHAFPDAVFFTTDLDAAMLHPSDNRFTRNLVVASSFGLTLHPDVQGPFAPFRDSYQTGAYLATRIALQTATDGAAVLGEDRIKDAIGPLLLEIGRTSAVRLNNPPREQEALTTGCAIGGEDEGPDWKRLECFKDWQPVWDNRSGFWPVLGGVMVLAGGGFLAAMISRTFRAFWGKHVWALVVALISAAVLGNWLYGYLPTPLNEPFSWIEGVSIWPTELLRLLTLLLTLFLLERCTVGLWEGDRDLHERFFAKAEEDTPPLGESSREGGVHRLWLLYQARQIATGSLDDRRHEPETQPNPSGTWWSVLAQLFRPVLLYVVTAAGFVLLFGVPQVPVRGDLMRGLDLVLLLMCVLSFAFLLFRVLDASRRVVWLAEGLKGPHTWPASTLHAHGCTNLRDAKLFDDYLDVRVVAAASASAQHLVYYPFAVFFLMVLSRSSIFDAWHVPASLYLIFALALGLIVLSVGWLRRIAERVREGSLRRMEGYLLQVQGRGSDAEGLEEQMRTMIEQVRTIREGAFAPIGQQPLVRAVLLLAGSVSGIAWLEAISNMGL